MADHLVFQVIEISDSIQAAYGQAALWALPNLRSTCIRNNWYLEPRVLE